MPGSVAADGAQHLRIESGVPGEALVEIVDQVRMVPGYLVPELELDTRAPSMDG